jgi:hypothetical protein
MLATSGHFHDVVGALESQQGVGRSQSFLKAAVAA